MNHRLGCVLMVSVLLMSAGVAAAESEGRSRRRENVKRAQVRGERNPFRYMKALGSFQKEIIEALEIDEDEELTEEIGDVFDKHTTAMREKMESFRKSRRESAERIRELVRELRESQQDEDTEEVQRIREEIANMRQDKPATEKKHEELFDAVRELLDEEQLARFNELAKDFANRIADSKDGDVGIRQLRRAVGMLDLSSEQRTQTRDIFVEGMREMRDSRRDPDKLKELKTKLHQLIVEELDEDQVEEFDKHLAQLKKKGSEKRRVRGHERIRRRIDRERDAETKDTESDGEKEEMGDAVDPDDDALGEVEENPAEVEGDVDS